MFTTVASMRKERERSRISSASSVRTMVCSVVMLKLYVAGNVALVSQWFIWDFVFWFGGVGYCELYRRWHK